LEEKVKKKTEFPREKRAVVVTCNLVLNALKKCWCAPTIKN